MADPALGLRSVNAGAFSGTDHKELISQKNS